MFEMPLPQTSPFDQMTSALGRNNVPELLEALDAGASPDLGRLDGSPLLFTIYRGYLDCARVLVTHGADPMKANRQGWSAVHEAARVCNVDAIGIVAESSLVRWNLRDNEGWTPLRAAVESHENPAVRRAVKALLNQEGLRVDQHDNKEVTPLMRAVELQSLEVVQLLLAAGADSTLRDEAGRSAQERAAGWEFAPAALFQAPARPVDVRSTTSVDGTEESVVEEVAAPSAVSTIRKRKPG